MTALWIQKEQETADSVTLSLEGQLTREEADLVDLVCRGWLATKSDIKVDIGAVSYISPSGIGILRGLPRLGIQLLNCSPLVEDLLQESSVPRSARCKH